MVFWFGGILGALLFIVGLLLLLQRRRGALTLTLIGLVMSALLIPALGLFRETQAYLYIGLAGVAVFVISLFFLSRGRWGVSLAGLGLVAATYLMPAFNLTQPWNTNPVNIISGLNTPTTQTPSTTEIPTTATPDTPTTETPTIQTPTTETPTTDTPTTENPSAQTPTTPDTATPNTDSQPTSPDSSMPSTATEPQATTPALPTPDTTQPSASTPDNAGSSQAPTTPSPDTTATPQVTSTTNDALCPCLLRVSTGISNATVELTHQGGQTTRQNGSVVDFNNLEMGNYILSVQAPGYAPYSTTLALSNNKSLIINLPKQ